MTTTGIRCGAAWSRTHYLSGLWGEGINSSAVLAWLVERFDDLAREGGSTASWCPATSELIVNLDEPSSFSEETRDVEHGLVDQYDRWRLQAEDEAMDWILNGVEAKLSDLGWLDDYGV